MMITDGRVSVVVAAFNASSWIEETLASVVAQSIGPDRLEVVVVDDGSTDATAAVAERFLMTSPVPSRVVRTANHGPSHARNVGWRGCSGSWIQFLDADDLLHPGKLARQVASTDGERTAVVYSPWAKVGILDSRWESAAVAVPDVSGDTVAALLRPANAIATGAAIHARQWLERVGGWDERLRVGEDHDLALRLAFAGGLCVRADAEQPLFLYRRHGPTVRSLTGGPGRGNAEVWLRLAAFVEDESRTRGELSAERAVEIARLYAGGAKWLAEYDEEAAAGWLDRLDAVCPGYVPDWSGKLRLASRMLGFRRTVWLAARAHRRRVPVDAASYLRSIEPSFHWGAEANAVGAAATVPRSAEPQAVATVARPGAERPAGLA